MATRTLEITLHEETLLLMALNDLIAENRKFIATFQGDKKYVKSVERWQREIDEAFSMKHKIDALWTTGNE